MKKQALHVGRATVAAAVLALFVVGHSKFAAAGTLIASESFEYSANVVPGNGGIGWGQAWQVPNAATQVVAPGLTFPNLAAAGNTMGPTIGGAFISRALASPHVAVDGESLIVSLLVQPQADGTPSSASMFGNFSGGGGFTMGDLPNADPKAGNWAIQNSVGSFYSNKPVVANQTTLLVGRVDFAAGADRMRLWVDPILNSTQSLMNNLIALDSTTADVDVANANVSQFNGVFYQNINVTAADLDEIMIFAVPEPGGFMLWSCLAALGGFARRSCV